MGMPCSKERDPKGHEGACVCRCRNPTRNCSVFFVSVTDKSRSEGVHSMDGWSEVRCRGLSYRGSLNWDRGEIEW